MEPLALFLDVNIRNLPSPASGGWGIEMSSSYSDYLHSVSKLNNFKPTRNVSATTATNFENGMKNRVKNLDDQSQFTKMRQPQF